MNRLDQLWNGDLIKLERTGDIGTFEGMNGNRIRLKIKNKVVLVEPTRIYILDDKEQNEYRKSLVKTPKPPKLSASIKPAKVPKTIDLHMEVLDPTHSIQSPARILDFQLNALIEYMKGAVQQKHQVVTIIHGHGMGVLKREVIFILEGMDYIMFTNPINDGGAIEAWLKH